jgi:hypothetical protein
MADPTNARTRTMHRFFDPPRFPIKELPRGPGDGERDHDDEHDVRDRRGSELAGWNAYVGRPT